ncbi:vanillate O-demethylase ferredoxin subunit [Tardiphaga sp. OK246]|jgi:vanillate O-demethylase ferredoxin subunit|uniref:PDR/VanB family oxidoreductase n=1 Tax=Tardiphaga sp. OK246 TaxID=1855307 RepID=UPI000B71FA9D|nr:PDR/VanB family oxidoreductase [Tardiphaga sp. OK246]SNT33765.1 vanillate O-demethylase ferredoxin subunit [Tardiphaga sp. OK246]
MSAVPITKVRTIVDTVEDGGRGIKLFSLVDPDHWELPPFRPGAHIDLHLPGGLVRTYSLCNDPADDKRYVVAVKREAEGRGGSIVLHDEVKVGDTIGVTLPRGGLDLSADVTRFTFIGGGIGVTPFLSAAAFLKRMGRSKFTLHMIARGEPPLADLLAALRKSGHVVIHDTSSGQRPDIAALVGRPLSDVALACCGPDGMIDDFEQASRDWPADRVHIERFVPPPLPVDPDAKPYVLALAKSKREITVAAGQTMLSALTDIGIDVPASCCGGICGSCKVDWLEGQPVHRDRVLSPAERERSLLVCVAGSAGDRLVLDL